MSIPRTSAPGSGMWQSSGMTFRWYAKLARMLATKSAVPGNGSSAFIVVSRWKV